MSAVHPADVHKGLLAQTQRRFYRWSGTLGRVIDGDTIALSWIDSGLLGIGVRPIPSVYITHVRFLGVDAPEHDTPEGEKALSWLNDLFGYSPPEPDLWITSYGLDGRGRILGTVETMDGVDVIAEGQKAGWLRPYNGRGPKPWVRRKG